MVLDCGHAVGDVEGEGVLGRLPPRRPGGRSDFSGSFVEELRLRRPRLRGTAPVWLYGGVTDVLDDGEELTRDMADRDGALEVGLPDDMSATQPGARWPQLRPRTGGAMVDAELGGQTEAVKRIDALTAALLAWQSSKPLTVEGTHGRRRHVHLSPRLSARRPHRVALPPGRREVARL